QHKTSAAPAATPIKFEDVTASAKIRFEHAISPEKKYLIESMSGGVMLLDYDQDGWLEIYFTNAPSVEQAKRCEKVPSALYHNNLPKFGEGATCRFCGIPVQCGPRGMKGMSDRLYHNNGDGTFAEVSKSAGVEDATGYYGLGLVWSDLNDDGRMDLFVADDST